MGYSWHLLARVCLFLYWVLLMGVNASAQTPLEDFITFKEARLTSVAGTRTVALPYELDETDYPASGGRVHFQMKFEAPALPSKPVGIFVQKMSLSGRLFVNGELIRACDSGELENLRCLHKPNLFVVPVSLWQVGTNTIDFEIYANSRQSNGLSEVTLGEADALYNDHFRWTYWLRNDLLVGLTWLSTLMGVIALSVALIIRTDPVYFWFGLSSIAHSFATFNNFVSRPTIDIELFVWIIFVGRMVAVPTGLLTYLAIFGKLRPWVVKTTVVYLLLAPLLFWVSGSARSVAMAIFAPFVLFAATVFVLSVRWVREAPSPIRITNVVMMTVLVAGGLLDWLRLAGSTDFVGTYYGPYAYGGMLFTIGTLLIRDLAAGLIQSRRERAELERRAAERMAYEVTEHIPIGTFTLLQKPEEQLGRFVFLSERFLELTGLEHQALIADARVFVECIHPDDKAQWEQAADKVRGSDTNFEILVRMLVRGQWRWISIEAAPRQMPDGATLWEGVLIDDTDRIHYQQENERAQAALQTQLIEQSRMEEREQLLRDMHDGFGSQLASVRMMAEKGRIQPEQFPAYLHELSADLHLVVDTMSHQDASLQDALVDFRYRLERRLSGERETTLHWAIDLDGMPRYTPRDILHLLRLLQESVNNVLKHANARNIWIQAQYNAPAGELVLSVRDDGKGLPEPVKKGRGLNNMRHRAREIGGELEIVNSHPGVEVRFRAKRPVTPQSESQQVVVAGLGNGLHL